jgi:glycosyltransferase involved in cell wall biosynthesis
MRIAVFHNLPSGGAKRVLYEEVKYLSYKNTIDLFVLTSEDDRFLDINPFCKNKFTFKFSIPAPRKFKRAVEDYLIFFSLRKLHKKIAEEINKGEYDFVLVHPDKYTQAPYVLRYLEIPSIYYCHEWLRIVYEKELKYRRGVNLTKDLYEIISRGIKKRIDYINTLSAAKVATNSNFTKKNVRDAYGIESIVIYPGVDTSIFKPRKVTKKNQALFIGEPVYLNNYKLSKEAINLARKKYKINLKILRPGRLRRVSDIMLSRIYSESVATLCLSLNEPFGMVPLESIACGTPVIALKAGGYKETIKKPYGELADNNPHEISRAIENIITKKGFLKNGNNYVKKNWSWEKHGNKLEDLIKSL